MQGVPPVTVAEFTLDGDGVNDFYDGTVGLICNSDDLIFTSQFISFPCGWLRLAGAHREYCWLPRC